jgi:DNA-binding response OmpR family regulator
MVATMIADALRDEGNDVRVSFGGEDGLLIIGEEWPDAVFLDIVMPGMDGNEVLRRIRASWPRLPVIIMTGWATDEQITLARRLGVAGVVAKPSALKNFVKAIEGI